MPFRGNCDKFGTTENGNYLEILDLISEHNSFLKEHVSMVI